MSRLTNILMLAVVVFLSSALLEGQSSSAIVTVKNPLSVARPGETIVLNAAELQKILPVKDVRSIHVRDDRTRTDLLTQSVDLNGDNKFDEFLFQTDLAANETRTFTLSAGEPQIIKPADFKAYGRFVQERLDDFAWENDRIAHRVYGKALETSVHEPLTSSAVDVWTKKVRRLVINDWYMVDDYHRDHGEGADFYSAGSSRGCGGNGIWYNGKLYPSSNFRSSRLIANGPIRVMFELSYDAWDVDGHKVNETKRITLDAGQNLGRFESFYTFDRPFPGAQYAAGIKKSAETVKQFNASDGILRTWETIQEGQLGIGVIVPSERALTATEDQQNLLVVARIPATGHVTYYAGFGWDQSGDFAGIRDWDAYLQQWSDRLRSPVEIILGTK